VIDAAWRVTGKTHIFHSGVGEMLDRGGLVVQMAKVIAGERVLDPAQPDEEARRRADEALARVEIFLGVDVDQARDIIVRVLGDVS
jgi:hypothetical protein